MSQARRPYGSVKDPITPGWRIARESKLRIDAMARNAGISSALMVELLAQNVELTDQGIPVWMPERDRSDELAIPDAEGVQHSAA